MTLNIRLTPGEHKRCWILDVRDALTAEHVQLPASDDWHATVEGLNMLSRLYGAENVALYQWDIHRVETDAI